MSRDILPEHPAELTLLDYLIGHLPPDVSDQIRRHVSSCRACRRTIAELSLTVDELDRLPTVPIPHDAVGDREGRRQRRRGSRLLRLLPALVLVGAAGSVLATFRLGGGNEQPATGTRVLVHTPASDPREAFAGLLDGIPHRLVQDAEDGDHWVVQVGREHVASAVSRLRPAADDPGPGYVVDVGGFDGPALEPYDG
jgi:anti-sigma factor RsiW